MVFILRKKIKNDYSKILYVESIYSLSLFNFINKNLDDTLVISTKGIFSERIIKNIPNFLELNNKIKPISNFETILLFYGFIPRRFCDIKSFINKKFIYYGHDHIRYSPLFYSQKMNIIEDGVKNYSCKKSKKDYFFKMLAGPFPLLGYSKSIEKVFLTAILDIPSKLKGKVEIISRSDYLKSLLTLNNGVYSEVSKIKKPFTLIITQPLSEDLLIDESEKIKIYANVINNEKNDIVIKPHPREKTNYNNVFNNVTVVDCDRLVESFVYNDYLMKVVTIKSTGIYAFVERGDVEMIEIDISYNSKLEKYFQM